MDIEIDFSIPKLKEIAMNAIEKSDLFYTMLGKLACLQLMHYFDVGTEYVPATKLIPEGYIFEFRNQSNRSISIKLFALDDKELVAINISNIENSETFSLINWLKYKKAFESYDEFHLTAYSGDFSQRADLFLAHLSAIFDSTSLRPILEGDRWENIPFDWAGMR